METIAAIATAPGRAAIAVVRASGPDVTRLMQRLFGGPLPERRPSLRWLHHPDSGERLDQVVATYHPGPASYTGEDVLELSGHGGALAPQRVLEAVQAAGARPARPGEFTRRAYLNGKLDLLQAEAILDLVDGRSEALHRAAIHQLERGLSRRIEGLRDAVVRAEALMVYEIDFPEEDEGPVPAERIDAAAGDVVARIDQLLETAAEGELLREGVLTVIAGRPNAGKSSLFNALLGVERAIVTEEPGTTRDAVEAVASLGGYPFRLVDTAGLRETEERVERIGIEVARRYLADADLVLFCAEAGRDLDDGERRFLREVDAPTFLVRTKADLHGGPSAADHVRPTAADGPASPDGDPPPVARAGPHEVTDDGRPSVDVSVVSGAGLAELRDRLVSATFAGATRSAGEAPLVTRRRHARQLRAARDEVEAFLGARREGLAPEVAATHLRSAAQALEELLGVVGPEDLLGAVFSEFCIGK
jgi:tRNA modification GTPase